MDGGIPVAAIIYMFLMMKTPPPDDPINVHLEGQCGEPIKKSVFADPESKVGSSTA